LIASTGITVLDSHITLSNFAAATNGTDGSFNFIVVISKGSANANATKTGNSISATPVYNVLIATMNNGNISADKTTVAQGEPVILTITPDEGYELDAISVYKTGEQITSVTLIGSGNTRTFSMPEYSVTVTATFKKTQEQLDKEALEAAKAAIEGGTYSIAQTTGNTKDDVKVWMVNTLNVLFGQSHGIQFRSAMLSPVGDVEITTLTPAIAGTKSEPEGTNGSFKFTVDLSEGKVKLTTNEVPGVIIATPYPKVPVIELMLLSNLTVRIINTGNIATGNLTLVLSGANADIFTLSAAMITGLAVDEEANITLIPRDNLAQGVYTAMLTVSGEGLESKSIEITHNVTSINNTPQAEPLKAWMQNNNLYISGLTIGKPWRVYNISGMLLYQNIANAATTNMSLPAHGVYFIQSGSKTIKVMY